MVFSYFWQDAPKHLVEWVSRRHTAFFMGMSTVVSIIFAVILSLAVNEFSMGGHRASIYVYLGALVVSVFFAYNATAARREARQMIDLWSHTKLDQGASDALASIDHSQMPSSGPQVATPSFRIFRNGDVKWKGDRSDYRKLYFDSDVDIVHTTLKRVHSEPPHMHSKNIESYLVEHGQLVLVLDGQEFVLTEGDLAVVYPGVCHSFRTAAEEVRFLAMKKYPGLLDKKDC